MNVLIKVVPIAMGSIFISAALNYFYMYKIYLGMQLYKRTNGRAWAQLGFVLSFGLIAFGVLFLKKYVCPNEFYDMPIQICWNGMLIISIVIIGVIMIKAIKSKIREQNGEK